MASKRLTAHVAPVPGRSMTPDTTRVEPGRRVDDEDSYLYANAGGFRNETRTWDDQRRECDDYRGGPPFVDRRPSFKTENAKEEENAKREESFKQEENFRQDSFKTENTRQESFRSESSTADPDPLDIFDPVPRPPSPASSYGYRDDPDYGALKVSAGELSHVDAGRRRHRCVEAEKKNLSREAYPQREKNLSREAYPQREKNFSREAYPQRGTMSGRVDGEPRPKVAVYEMDRIPKKVNLQESDEERLLRLRSEHAKIEVRTEQLKLLIERTVEKENDLRRMNKGRPVADNKEFCDNKKLQMDAQKKYEDALRCKREMEVTLNAILSAQKQKAAPPDTGDNSQDGESMPVATSRQVLISTDFLDDKREDREEEIDGASKIEFFDGGDHWCEPCQDVFVDNVKTFLDHLHTDDHWKVS